MYHRAHATDCCVCFTNTKLLTLYFTLVGSALFECGQASFGASLKLWMWKL